MSCDHSCRGGPNLLGSSQDGSGSQHEAGCIRKAVEGGLGQGETHPCVPRPVLDGVDWLQPARACNRFLTDLLSIGNKRTRSETGRVGLNLSSPGPSDSIGAPIPPWRFVLVCCSPGGPNDYFRFTFRNMGHGCRTQASSFLSQSACQSVNVKLELFLASEDL